MSSRHLNIINAALPNLGYVCSIPTQSLVTRSRWQC